MIVIALSSGQSVTPAAAGVFDEGRFSFELPAGWREIPRRDLDDLTEWIAVATAGRSVELYQYGFIPPSFEADPWLPHLLIQVREGGRIPYGRFIDLEGRPRSVTADPQRPRRDLPRLILGVDLDRAGFDRSRFCLRLEHTLDLRFKGRARVQTAAFLTEKGVIALHYIDREARTDEARSVFDQIVASVTIAPDIAYRPRVLDRWPGLPFFIAAVVVAAALVIYLATRRRST